MSRNLTRPWRWTTKTCICGSLVLLVWGSWISFTAGSDLGKPGVVKLGGPEVGAMLPPLHVKLPPSITQPAETIALPRKTLAINFDMVLRLVKEQNGQVDVAWAKVDEAVAAQAVAYQHFPPPDIHLRKCIAKKVEADVQVWKSKVDLAKATSENLQDAAYTYVDLLAAKIGEEIAKEVEQKLRTLLSQAKKLAEIDPGIKVEATRVEAEVAAQLQVARKVREGMRSGTAKLIYLLGLDPNTYLLIGERQFTPLRLVDTTQPIDVLISQAQMQGPGVYEFEGMLAVIEQAQARANGSHLAHLLSSSNTRQVQDAKANQAYLTFEDLLGKLTMGVKEAVEASRSATAQMALAKTNVKAAEETYNLADYRLKNSVKGRSPTEVLFSIRSLGEARLNYLQAVRDHNKAQIRLFILLGANK